MVNKKSNLECFVDPKNYTSSKHITPVSFIAELFNISAPFDAREIHKCVNKKFGSTLCAPDARSARLRGFGQCTKLFGRINRMQ